MFCDNLCIIFIKKCISSILDTELMKMLENLVKLKHKKKWKKINNIRQHFERDQLRCIAENEQTQRRHHFKVLCRHHWSNFELQDVTRHRFRSYCLMKNTSPLLTKCASVKHRQPGVLS